MLKGETTPILGKVKTKFARLGLSGEAGKVPSIVVVVAVLLSNL